MFSGSSKGAGVVDKIMRGGRDDSQVESISWGLASSLAPFLAASDKKRVDHISSKSASTIDSPVHIRFVINLSPRTGRRTNSLKAASLLRRCALQLTDVPISRINCWLRFPPRLSGRSLYIDQSASDSLLVPSEIYPGRNRALTVRPIVGRPGKLLNCPPVIEKAPSSGTNRHWTIIRVRDRTCSS